MKIKIFTLLFAILSLNGFAQWTSLDIPVSTNLYCLSFINEQSGMVAGEQGTLLKTATSGLEWESFTITNEDFRSVCMVNYELHFVGGTYLYRTIDGGSHWDTITELHYPSSINFSDDLTGIVTCASGVYQTTDGGASWTEVINGSTSVYETSTMFDNTSITMGNVGGMVSYSAIGMRTDADQWYSFDVLSFPNSNAYTSVFFPNPDTGYLCMNQFNHWVPGDHNQFVRLTNFSLEQNWFGDYQWFFLSEVVNDNMPDLMNSTFFTNDQYGYACGQNGSIYITHDGGVNWGVDYAGTTPLSKMQFVTSGIAYAVGNAGTLLKHVIIEGTENNELNNPISIYPNPVKEYFNLESLKNIKLIEVINTSGKRVLALQPDSKVKEIQVNAQNLSAGIYLSKITFTDGTTQSVKIMVEE